MFEELFKIRAQPLPSDLSIGPLRRAVFGLWTFFCSLAFGACAVALAVRLAIVGPPVVLWKAILVHLVIDVFAIASIFMLLLAISFWAPASRWTDRLLRKIMPKGVVAVVAIVAMIFVTAALVEPALAIAWAVSLVVAFSVLYIIILMRKRSHAEYASFPFIEFEEPNPRAFRFGLASGAAGYRNRAALCRRLLFAACALVASLGVALRLSHLISTIAEVLMFGISVAGGTLTEWLWMHARFCRVCGASTRTAMWGQALTWCPACCNLIDPAQVGVFDVRAGRYMDRRERAPRFLSMVALLAIYEKARQIRFEPTRSSYEIYLSIGDETYQMEPGPVFIQFAAAQIVKAMAGLDMNTCDRSQEGNIRVVAHDRTITTRVVVEPAQYGQRVIFRFLDTDSCPKTG